MPLLKAEYINHNGKKIAFGTGDGLFLNEHDLMNFSWNVQARGNRIVGVDRRGVKEHTIPLVIIAPSKEQACRLANDLFSICEADMQANQKGRLVVNGYNLRCFIRGQDYTEWSDLSKCLKISAKVIRDSIWYKPLQSITFNTSNTPQIGVIDTGDPTGASLAGENDTDPWTGGEKGYFHGYPYDYPSTLEEFYFENNYGTTLSWEATIWGAASLIEFYIGNTQTTAHKYEVLDVSLAEGERLEIVAKEALDEKTVFKVDVNGNRTNCFANRSRSSYLFEPIPTGGNYIMSSNNLKWRLTPIVERSTPEWL